MERVFDPANDYAARLYRITGITNDLNGFSKELLGVVSFPEEMAVNCIQPALSRHMSGQGGCANGSVDPASLV
jgi:hypothetical protein